MQKGSSLLFCRSTAKTTGLIAIEGGGRADVKESSKFEMLPLRLATEHANNSGAELQVKYLL